MSIAAHPGEAGKVNAAFAAFAETHELPPDVRRSVSVALDELLANVRSHGLAGRDASVMTVAAGVDQQWLTVTITDDGPAFDPFARAAPDTALPVEERPVGGLGIHLVRRLMDEVRYQRVGGRNVVVLVKQLAPGQSDGFPGGRSMQVSTRTVGDIHIVAVAGNLDSTTSPEAQKALDVVLASARKVALDFTALDYISSAGLRVLLGAAKHLRASGGSLRMFGLNQSVREVFEISGFSTILAVHSSEAEALAAF